MHAGRDGCSTYEYYAQGHLPSPANKTKQPYVAHVSQQNTYGSASTVLTVMGP